MAAKLLNSPDITSKKVFFSTSFRFFLSCVSFYVFLHCGHTPLMTYSASSISNPGGSSTMGI